MIESRTTWCWLHLIHQWFCITVSRRNMIVFMPLTKHAFDLCSDSVINKLRSGQTEWLFDFGIKVIWGLIAWTKMLLALIVTSVSYNYLHQHHYQHQSSHSMMCISVSNQSSGPAVLLFPILHDTERTKYGPGCCWENLFIYFFYYKLVA